MMNAPLTLYPAIDLKDGACVRLIRGRMEDATVFSGDPAAQARAWEHAGCRWLHVVDLNGAVAGHTVNETAVASVLHAATVPVQLGGGVRNRASIDRWIEAGVRRVVLGSAAVRDPALVRDACRAYPGRIAVSIDAREGQVATDGWTQTSSLRALDLALRYEDAGVAAIIYTDIGRDGTLTGLNLEQTFDLAYQIATPVIASGGVADLSDLVALREQATRDGGGLLEGVIVGRALYDGRIAIGDALAVLAG